jgi:GT2 family glycosyltransferase
MISSVVSSGAQASFVIVDNGEVSHRDYELFCWQCQTHGIHVEKQITSSKVPEDISANVTDRGDSDETRSRLWFLTGMGNLGFGAGMNAALDFLAVHKNIAQLEFSHIALVNPDVLFERLDFKALLKSGRSNTRTLYAPRYLNDSGDYSSPIHYFSWLTGLPARSKFFFTQSYFCGACLFADFSCFEDLRFDERYFLYWEEVDLQLKLKNEGWDFKIINDISIYHSQGETMPSSHFAAVQFSKSRILFFKKHLSTMRFWMVYFFGFFVNGIYLLFNNSEFHSMVNYETMRSVMPSLSRNDDK